MQYDFGGRVAVVSGGSRGIGLAIARGFAGCGGSVAIAGQRQETVDAAVADLQELARQAGKGGSVLGVAADLSQAEGVQRLVDATLERFGGVDILANNVGAARSAPFLELPDEILLSAWSLKLLCAIRLTRALVPAMQARGGGVVVNIAGTAGREPRPEGVAVATANAGVRAFTKAVSSELARSGISINVITPSRVRTDRQVEQAERQARARGMTLEQVMREAETQTPTGRVTEPDEVAELALFLAARRVYNLTGAEIVLDGGATRSL